MESVLEMVTMHPWACLAATYILFCFVMTRCFKRSKLDLVYQKGSPMEKIVDESNLRQLEYVPYIFAWYIHLQGVIFVPYNAFKENFFTPRYYREVFAFKDGEEIALDWFEEAQPKGDELAKEQRPLLVCIGGLGGGHTAPYMTATMKRTRELGYQVVFVLFRGTGDMPLRGDKMYCLTSWQDIKEPTDYIYGQYCKNQGRRMYLYGVSLGGGILSQYLINDDANNPYSGVATYGAPTLPELTVHYFKNLLGGIYDVGLGLSLNGKIRAVLPHLEPYTTKEKMEIYRNGLYNESWRLTSIDTHIIATMFGYEDSTAYYKAARVKGKLHAVTKCPVMWLQSMDDFLMQPAAEAYPLEECRKQPNLLFATTKFGGHCCHLTHSSKALTGLPFIDWISWAFPSSSWFATPIMDFFDTIEQVHKRQSKNN